MRFEGNIRRIRMVARARHTLVLPRPGAMRLLWDVFLKIFNPRRGGFFCLSRPEDEGILAYAADDNAERGKILWYSDCIV